MTFVYGNTGTEPFTLNEDEKTYIRAYVVYKQSVKETVRLSDILETFSWDDPTNKRFLPAYRDWRFTETKYDGEFHRLINAIDGYIKDLSGSK